MQWHPNLSGLTAEQADAVRRGERSLGANLDAAGERQLLDNAYEVRNLRLKGHSSQEIFETEMARRPNDEKWIRADIAASDALINV